MISKRISRRRFIETSALGTAALAVTSKATAADAAPKPRPNLIYVFADQLRYLSCGYAGDRRAHTPNIDRLAAGGVDFQNCVSMTPVCSAYRASLMTGKYTTSTGMVINELRLSPELLKQRMQRLNDTFAKCTWYRGQWTQDRNIIRGAKGGSHDLEALNAIEKEYFG